MTTRLKPGVNEKELLRQSLLKESSVWASPPTCSANVLN